MITDVIVTWPRNCDYPLWRQFIHESRVLFREVYVSFMESFQGYDYRPFVREVMAYDRITFFNPAPLSPGEDWRNQAINTALRNSTAEWVWFTEQDFVILKDEFFTDVGQAMQSCKYITVFQGQRMHPCCLFVRRDVIDKTTKNFGIMPDKLDHFGIFQYELEKHNPFSILRKKLYFHYNGLSHNFRLISEGQPPVYEPNTFYEYLEKSLKVPVPLSEEYNRVAKKALADKPRE